LRTVRVRARHFADVTRQPIAAICTRFIRDRAEQKNEGTQEKSCAEGFAANGTPPFPIRTSRRSFVGAVWPLPKNEFVPSAASHAAQPSTVAIPFSGAFEYCQLPSGVKLFRAFILLGLTLAYLSIAFRLSGRFWTAGLGDWYDPYFINYLLEHWCLSAVRLTDPTSPPMFYPAEGTLGYSHGLILYAPFYAAVRWFLHPFQAYNTSLFLVMATGVVCLYVIFRKFVRLTFLESLALSLFFLTSPNVMNDPLGVWAQRASVFLVPAIVLAALVSYSMCPGPRRILAAAATGLLSTLLYVQDFYTAHFVYLFAGLAVAGWLVLARPAVAGAFVEPWRTGSAAARGAMAILALAALWTALLLATGGGSINIFGQRVSSRDWSRPAAIVLAALTYLVWLRTPRRSWVLPFVTGAFAGGCAFLSIYLHAYREHHEFPAEVIAGKLIPFQGTPAGYDSVRSFAMVLLLAAVAWIPRAGVTRTLRVAALAALSISLLVLAIPFRFGSFSVWMAMRALLPGFSSISDPLRIIYVYELAAVLWIGWFLSRLRPHSAVRLPAAAVVVILIAIQPNVVRLAFLRPRETYARWVEAPIRRDPSCRVFYIKNASPAYGERPNNPWTTFHMDAMWVALRYSIPTLNGYSAWTPPGYAIGFPHEPGYDKAVADWIDLHKLRGVCAFDVEARTMTPR
jgi:hypothetical protein